MKKVLSLLLATVLCLGIVTSAISPTLGQQAETLGLGTSGQSTVPNGAAGAGQIVSSIQGDTLYPGNTFTVTFAKAAFVWSGTGATHSLGNIDASWLRVEGLTLGTHIALATNGIAVDPTYGHVTFTFTVINPQESLVPLKIYLQSPGVLAPTAAFAQNIKISGQTQQILKTKAGGTAPTVSRPGDLTLNTGDTMTFTFPANNFDWSAGGAKDASLLKTLDPTGSWVRLSSGVKGKDFDVSYTTAAGAEQVTVTVKALRAATYNNFSVSLLGGSGGVTTAGSPQQNVVVSDPGARSKIIDISSDALLGGTHSGAFLNGKALSYGDVTFLTVHAGDELLIPFTAGFFVWDGTAPYAGTPVTTTQLRQGKIDIRSSNRRGGNIFDSSSPTIINRDGRAYIQLKFLKDITSLKDVDFSMTLFLTVDRTRDTDSQLEIDGVLKRDVHDLWPDETYFDLSDGSVILPEKFMRNVELYLGNGVTMFTSLLGNKRYSATATNELRIEDETLLRRFPSIEEIYRINTTSLTQRNGKVSFDIGSASYFVYDSDGKYLGRSNATLPYSPIYYFSTKEINMNLITDDDEKPLITPQPGLEPPPVEDWDKWTTPPNQNDNPGTGW